jgi:hypothetical protein
MEEDINKTKNLSILMKISLQFQKLSEDDTCG